MRVVLAFLVACCAGCSFEAEHSEPLVPAVPAWESTEQFRLHAPDLSALKRQQDLYLLEFRPDPHAPVQRFMIDTGHATEMASAGAHYLRRLGVQHIDRLYITHPHKDHYEGLEALEAMNVSVGELVMNTPDAARCNTERPWGCDLAHVASTLERWASRGVKHRQLHVNDPKQAQREWQGGAMRLDVLWAPTGVHPVLGAVNINDMSMVMRLQVGEQVMLFTGDLNVAGGAHLLAQLGPVGLKADVLKVPHHGAESTVSDGVFKAISPTHALVPSPASLWCSLRSQRIRDTLKQLKTETYVMGLHGDVMVRHFTDRPAQWSSSRPVQTDCQTHLGPRLPNWEQLVWGDMHFALDQIVVLEWQGMPALKAKGWKFSQNPDEREHAPALALQHEQDQRLFAFGARAMDRPDVYRHFAKERLGAGQAGFELVLSLEDVPPGPYKVVLLRHKGSKARAVDTGKRIEVQAAGARVLN
jgi:beta-lactamase superfamily II metal-dependent hydrolase